VKQLPWEVQNLIAEGVELNELLAEEGLKGNHGARLGIALQRLVASGAIKDDWITKAKVYTAAACDARMGGAMKAAMSTAGSGNQGIMATMPIIVAAHETGVDKKRLVEALAVAHLITSYAAYYSGELSASCGCGVKAGIGATAGLAYYFGGGEQEVGDAINNFAATVPGMVCDGAKPGCAFKLSSVVGISAESALLANQGVKVPHDGLVDQKPEQTMQNIGMIANGSVALDMILVKGIMNK